MTGRPPFLFSRSRYMKRVQLFNGRYTKGVSFVKNSIFKGKALDLGAKPLRAKLYWVASRDIRAAFSGWIGLASMLHSVLVDNLWICYEKGARSSPLGGRWWAQDAAGLLGQRFFWTKRQNGGLRFTLDWHECLRWRRSFNNFNGSY